jgi:hypothetical protein
MLLLFTSIANDPRPKVKSLGTNMFAMNLGVFDQLLFASDFFGESGYSFVCTVTEKEGRIDVSCRVGLPILDLVCFLGEVERHDLEV